MELVELNENNNNKYINEKYIEENNLINGNNHNILKLISSYETLLYKVK